ncbi:MAG: GIY-YIG nuclease family protein [Acidobacteria bacterium]|nr:GIY-YIG nuclease family protein [Acidobacteriota bacterium]
MYWVYILYSQTCERYYCGQTAHLDNRVLQHNDPAHTFTKTTKRFQGPWTLVWSIGLDTRPDALAIEKQIKRQGIRWFLERNDIPPIGC